MNRRRCLSGQSKTFSRGGRLAASVLLAGFFLAAALWLIGAPVSAAGITVWKTTPAASVKAGEPVTYTIHVLNSSGYRVTVVISDTVPARATVVDAGTGVLAGGVIVWSDLPVDHSSTVEVTFTVVATQVGPVVNADYRATSATNFGLGTPLTTTIVPNDPAVASIVVAPSPIGVGGSAALTVTVVDAYGNAVADGTPVALQFDRGRIDGQPPGTTIAGSTTGGRLVKTLEAGTVAATAHLTATAGIAQGAAEVVINPGPPSGLTVNAAPPSVVADGVAAATITTTVRDVYGNPVPATPVTVTTSLGGLNGGGPSALVTTNAPQGQAVATLSGTVAGTATITAAVGALVDASQRVYLAPGPPTQLSLQAAPAAIVADGANTSTVTLRVLDQYNNRVDTPVSVTITTNLGTLPGGGSAYSATTGDGQIQVLLTAGTQAGLATIVGTALGLNTDTSVNFVPGPPASISLDVKPAAIQADGASTAVLTGTVRDVFGNRVSTPVSVTFAVEAGTLLPGPNGTTTNGVITRTLRSSAVVTTTPVTATAAGLGAPATGSVAFVAGPPASAELSLSPPSPVTAGQPVSLTVTVRDNVGHPASGVAITVTHGLGSLSPSPGGTTDGSGRVQRTLVSTRTGSDTLGVLGPNGPLPVSGGSVQYLPDSPAQAFLTAAPGQLFANGATTAVVTATLTDRFGNPVPGISPVFTTSLGWLSGSGATNGAGVATRTLHSTTDLGPALISVSGLLTVTPATVEFVTGPPAQAVLQATPASAVADGQQSVSLAITVTDSIGHPLVGQTLAVTSTFGAVSACAPTDGQGVLRCTLRSTRSGTPQIYAAGLPTSGGTVTFLPGPLHHVQVTPFGTFGAPVSTVAGIPFTFTATGQDFYNNPIAGLAFDWNVTSWGGSGGIDGGGVFRGATAGLVAVTAREAGSGKTGISYARIAAGSAAMAAIEANPRLVTADGASVSNLTIRVTDAYGNAVGAGVPLTVTSSIGLVEGSASTDAGGAAPRTVRSTQAGAAVIGVTNLLTVTGDTVITFTPGSPARALVSAAPLTLPPNGVAQAVLTVTLFDAFDNPVGAGFTPTVQSSLGTVSGGSATGPAGTVTRTLTAPLVEGVATFSVRYLGGSLPVGGDTVSFEAGPLDHVTISPAGPLSLAAGQPAVFTAQGFDANNAPIPAGVDYSWFASFDGAGRGQLSTPPAGPQTTFTGTVAGGGVQLIVWAVEGGTMTASSAGITVVPGPPISATIAATPTLLTADGVSPITFTLTNLVDAYGNPSAAGTVLTVTIQSEPAARSNTGAVSGGAAVVIVPAATRTGTYPVSASSAGRSLALSGPTSVTFVPGPPAQAQIVSATPAAILADGVSTSTLVLQVRDVFGNKVAAGLTPAVASTLGSILGAPAAPTDGNGVLTRTLRAGLVVGSPLISVDGFAASGASVSLIPGPPVRATLGVVTSTLAAGGSGTIATFDVRDVWDHPVADGIVITPTLAPPSLGSFSGPRVTKGGLVTQTLTPGTAVGTALAGSEGLTVTGAVTITVAPGPAAIARVTAAPASTGVGGTSSLTITVTDAYGNVAPPAPVTVTATLGTLDGAGRTITRTTAAGSGLITASLSSTVAGTETLALSGPAGALALDPASDAIVFLPDAPVAVTLEPAGSITATAGVTLTVTASSRDAYGNPVDPWLPVDYTWWQSATAGAVGYGSLTAADPRARSLYFLPRKAGLNRLWATGGVAPSPALTVNVVAGPPATATVAVAPASLPADGLSTFAITLTNLADAYGNPVPDGSPLTVTVQSVPPVTGVGTTAGGSMAGVLSTTTRAGAHAIAIRGTGGPLGLSGVTSVTFTPGPPVSAAIEAAPKALPGDGASTSVLTVTVRDVYGNLVADGLPITVTTNLGTLSGAGSTLGGRITRTLRAPVALGTASFTVEGPGGPLFVTGDTVAFQSGPPALALISAAPPRVLADGVSTSRITVTVKDAYGFTVPGSGTAVLTVTRGSLAPTTTVATGGVLTATFRAGTSVGPAGLAVAYGGVALPTVGDSLELVPGPPVTGTLAASPTSLKVGSAQGSTLVLSLVDAWGRPVADGTAITVTASLGSVPAGPGTAGGVVTRTLAPGLTMGTATFTATAQTEFGAFSLVPAGDTVTITPGDLDHVEIFPAGPVQVTAGSSVSFSAAGHDVYHNATGTGLYTWKLWPGSGGGTLTGQGVFTATTAGTMGVQAVQGTVFSPIKTVTIVPGPPVTATVSASPLAIPVGGATSELVITARDALGNLMADGTVLTVTSDLGTISGAGAVQGGVLRRTLRSGSFYGPASIFVNGWVAAGDQVIFVPRAQVTAVPGSLPADGASQAVLTIAVFDTNGGPVPDGTQPTITTTLGSLSGSGGTKAGVLTRTLRAAATPGVARIYVNGLLAEGEVPFTTGPAAVARISANPAVLIADGTSASLLTIVVEDAYGHVITNAGPLTVTTSLGTIGGVAPTINGRTTRLLTAADQAGMATISVAGLTTAGQAQIYFAGAVKDGGFETGGLANWTVGGVITTTGGRPVYTATVLGGDVVGGILITPRSGQSMVRLGATTADNTAHEQGEAWLRQPVYVPTNSVTQVTFWYRLLSYDVAVGAAQNGAREWDPLEVYLNGQEVLQDGYVWTPEWQAWHGPPLPASPKDMGWKQGVLDLTTYAGQVVTLEFRVSNRQGPVDNTWVYLDEAKMTSRKLYKAFLPLMLRGN